ncbi:transposase [[Bacillus thuringiensis] serovar konkukian]|nr:Mu transposase C-terminal domain-containing protein [Bacillus thuringiensis]MED1305534.1 Mu transposase C-terminal domain-containing protein [Bacillus pacificus]OUB02566.1 transposase [[Bacillus thuringiensis] serovar konkukian]OUB08100.1 transposase [[Bacillus thuringiensis] serovar konkukian]OUB10720.1 transposase [[Bacillus thuringiensis] serovar konkukian]OUB10923.1 transposase [[Bacillus thuringiensis] serovar konkukian]
MDKKHYHSLTQCTDQQLEDAYKKYKIIFPYLENEKTVQQISNETKLSIRIIQYWICKFKENGLLGLVRKERSDCGKFKIPDLVQQQIHKIHLENKNISISSIHRRTKKWCEENGLAEPSYYQVWSFISNIPKNLTELAQYGRKHYEDKYDLVYLREAKRPNEFWQADHTMLDIEILNSKGQPERPWLTIILDDYSRAIAGFYIDFGTPDTIRTALTLRQAIWRKGDKNWPICGIPETFYTDHGSDYTSQHMEQVSADLKMVLSFSRVGVPRGRGKIERFFRTVNMMFLQDLPGYIKNHTSQKLMTLNELLEQFHQFILNTYHYRIHGTTNKRPIEMWNESRFLPNMPESLQSLDLLLLSSAKPRKIHSDGIHFLGLKYMHTNLSAFVGEDIMIRYDPRDIAEIRVFYKGTYLCTAISSTVDGYSIGLKELQAARNKQRRKLKNNVMITTKSVVEHLKIEKDATEKVEQVKPITSKLKRYKNE